MAVRRGDDRRPTLLPPAWQIRYHCPTVNPASLSSLLACSPVPLRRIGGGGDPPIEGICDDPRRVQSGAIFFARTAVPAEAVAQLEEACRRGAAAAVAAMADPAAAVAMGPRPLLAAADSAALRIALAAMAERFHGDPSRRLGLVGVTGTNGKTTVCFLLQQLLAAAGRRCGLFGTVHFDDGETVRPSALTTPGAIELSAGLARMVANGCDSAVMEVSSHGLDQRRVAGLRFAVAVFTNLSGDHLDYHGSMAAYAAAKRRLFESLDPEAVAIVNRDDPTAASMAAAVAGRVVATSLGGAAEISATVSHRAAAGSRCSIATPWGRIDCHLPLPGDHNVRNLLAAVAAAGTLGVPAAAIEAAIPSLAAPPGRLEPVPDPDGGRLVLVDYAHTDDALGRALEALRPLRPRGTRLWVVFGCGGDRDRSKRPRMGEVAASLADEVVVTSDNPRTEDPRAIVAEIVAGIPPQAMDRVTVEVDRAAAIESVLRRAGRGDLVLIAGKGHEDYQIVGTERRPFDDRRIAAEAISRMPKAAGGRP
jgi:UDP-N-acetylmuramoyl-L-alanyl-D-glutamate--2,6-diaminopimelate ligase